MQNYIKKIFSGLIPIRRFAAMNPRFEQKTIATTMSADRIHNVFDSAQAGDTRDLFALYRDILLMDAHLQGEFTKRKLAVLGDTMSVLPFDKSLKPDVDNAAFIKQNISGCLCWIKACSHLLDSTLMPVAVLEKVFRPALSSRFELCDLSPVSYQLLDFTTGKMRIRDVDSATGMPMHTTHEVNLDRYIVHRGHLLNTPDHFGGPMRSLVFWWLFSAMDRDWWARFLDRFGSPFLLGRYDADDEQGRTILERAFNYAVKIGGLVTTKDTEVEIKEAVAGNNGEAYDRFLSICQREKSKLILGQTLSAEAQPTGLGSGVAQTQEAVRQDVRRFDATLLGSTLREQLMIQLLDINGMPGNAPTANWGAESIGDLQSLANLLTSLAQAGFQVSDNSISTLGERLGLQIERKSMPVAPDLMALSVPTQKKHITRSVKVIDSLSRGASAGLAQAFRGSLAPVRKIIEESRSPEECEARISEFYADWNPARLSGIIAEALEAFAANGAMSNPD